MPRNTHKTRKGKGGRPKGKPLSAKERAQRRAAAIKTGEYATTALAQALPPCKPRVCPNGGTGTCDIKKAVEARGAGLSACLVSLGHHDTVQAYLNAIQSGDLQGVAELAATSMAGQLALAQSELATLLHEGLVVQTPIVGRNAEGDLEVIAERPVENPRAANTLTLLRQLGHTAADQAITPKSSGERDRDRGLGLAGRIAWVNQMRQGLLGVGVRGVTIIDGPLFTLVDGLPREAGWKALDWQGHGLRSGVFLEGPSGAAVHGR